MQYLRVFAAALCLVLLMATAALADGYEKITLPNGEVVELDQSGTQTKITLPNGATFTRSDHGRTSSWSGGEGASDADWEQAQQAYDIWSAKQPRERSVPIWVALLVLAISLINLFAPRFTWYLSEGWKFKDAEPSDAALIMGRGIGVIGSAVGLGLLFFG